MSNWVNWFKAMALPDMTDEEVGRHMREIGERMRRDSGSDPKGEKPKALRAKPRRAARSGAKGIAQTTPGQSS